MAFLSSIRSVVLSVIFWLIFWNLWNLKKFLVADFTKSLDRPTIVTTTTLLPPPVPSSILDKKSLFLLPVKEEEDNHNHQHAVVNSFEIIFYFHSFIQVERKRFMESWLNDTNHRSIEVVSGDPLECSTILCHQNIRLTRTYELLVRLYLDSSDDQSSNNGLPILVLHQNNLRLSDMSSLSRSILSLIHI